MKKFIETLKNIWKIEDLRARILTTLGLLLIYRLGSYVVLPGVDPAALEVANAGSGGGLMDLLNIFAGGANFHSKTEWLSVDGLVTSIETLLNIVKVD